MGGEMNRQYIEGVLLRCFIMGFGVMLIWFLFFIFADGLVYNVHGWLFPEITKHEFQVMHYSGMGLLKLFVTVVFFLPWVAMKWADKGTKLQD